MSDADKKWEELISLTEPFAKRWPKDDAVQILRQFTAHCKELREELREQPCSYNCKSHNEGDQLYLCSKCKVLNKTPGDYK